MSGPDLSLDSLLKLHEGGKLEVRSTTPLKSVDDLRRVYTPGVASVCMHIHDHPETLLDYTMIGHTVAIVTNGTAVLGLGDIGARAGMPVMEGKAVLLKCMGGVDAFPVLIESKDPAVIAETVGNMHHGFGAIMLEDIAAPECFAVERKLQERLDKPVFHDDQHGTAVVTFAALLGALRRVDKDPAEVRVVVSGAGAAGIAVTRFLMANGVRRIVLCDSKGALYPGRPDGMNPEKHRIALETNPDGESAPLGECMAGTDVFIGLSRKGLVSKGMVRSMAKDAVVLAMANPEGEISPEDALDAGAAVAADGKHINNALGFPGIFRGALAARARSITTDMLSAASKTLADITPEKEILPDFMDLSVHSRVGDAVAAAAPTE